jgi:hypothetical protein
MCNGRVAAMSELQKIAVGLLSMSHPEIYRFRTLSAEPALSTFEPPDLKRTHGSKPTPAAMVLRGVKFAFASLLAGARSIPLGDNGRITRELGEYGAHLKGC